MEIPAEGAPDLLHQAGPQDDHESKARCAFDTELPEGLGITGLVISDRASCKSWAQNRSRFIGTAPLWVTEDVAAKFKALLP